MGIAIFSRWMSKPKQNFKNKLEFKFLKINNFLITRMDLLMNNRKHLMQTTSIKYIKNKKIFIIKKLSCSRERTFKMKHFKALKKFKAVYFCKKMSQMILNINNKCKLKIMNWTKALDKALLIKVKESTKIYMEIKN